MVTIVLVVIAFFVTSMISSYLTWGPLTSSEMVDYFGPPINAKEKMTEKVLHERKRKAGMMAEILRAFLISAFCMMVLPFYSTSIEVGNVLFSPFFRWSFLGVFVISFLWCFYLGPRFFALRHCGSYRYFSSTHFRKYIRPYWAWFPYPLLIFGGIGILTFVMIVEGIISDADAVRLYAGQINGILLMDIEHIQYATIRLIEFGDLISEISQKYVLTTALIFLYVIIEQRSSMHNTILDTSVERLKYFVWAGLIFTVGFSLVVLPSQYDSIHMRIQNSIESMSYDLIYPDHLGDVLSMQKTLEDHDLRWVFLKIVTGYGNILTAAIVGIGIVAWRLFFEKVPVKYILGLVVPKYIMNRLEKISEDFRVDMNIQNDPSS